MPILPVFPVLSYLDTCFNGIISDIDGTLVDTNPAHIEAWPRAFQRLATKDEAEASKPAPDLLFAAIEKLEEKDTGHIYDELDRVLEIASSAAAASR